MTDQRMQYGAVLPGGTATEQLADAELAERAGWDAVFVWETAYGVDAWSLLAAMVARAGRRRGGGRGIPGLGRCRDDAELPDTGEVTDLRERAARMDEGIDLIHALWEGQDRYEGRHYQYRAGGAGIAASVRPA